LHLHELIGRHPFVFKKKTKYQTNQPTPNHQNPTYPNQKIKTPKKERKKKKNPAPKPDIHVRVVFSVGLTEILRITLFFPTMIQ